MPERPRVRSGANQPSLTATMLRLPTEGVQRDQPIPAQFESGVKPGIGFRT
jgi:hypothetical protein